MRFTDYDSYLFHEGTHYAAYEKLGAHITTEDGVSGTRFAVYAPGASICSVITCRNGWDPLADPMTKGSGGVWECFIPGMGRGDQYRYVIVGADGISRYKSDPYAFMSELRPENASVVWPLDGYDWQDGVYAEGNRTPHHTSGGENGDAGEVCDADRAPDTAHEPDADCAPETAHEPDADCAPGNVPGPRELPMSIYEVHLGSWKKDYRENKDGFLNYRRLADELSEYVTYMGFTHVELMGICEYPFDGSWGYQVTGYFSPTSRYGSPDDFRYFVDRMHRSGIGIILDWVPAHFPKDSFGLEHFDGTALYESADPLLAEYPEWGTMAFDHSKPEVRSFLISSAVYWIKEFHIDALRVDAVAAMLYTSYSRPQWRPNRLGGNENLDSIAFIRQCNKAVRELTGGYLIAEDSSEMRKVTGDTADGGLGFMFKWNMGWMNDTLKYLEKDPVYRGWHHKQMTHTVDYVYTEYFVNVLSHDEVVHLKKPMVGKMAGAQPEKMAALKTLYTYQYVHPGKKLLFMGQEFAQESEWDENRIIDWEFANDEWHRDIMDCVRRLNALYKKYPCLYTDSLDSRTFEWVNRDDAMRSTVSFIRRNPWNYNGALLVICNFSPVRYDGYSCGVPECGGLRRVFSSYDSMPGEMQKSEDVPLLLTEEGRCDGYDQRITYDLRPYESVVFLIRTEEG